MKHLICSLVMGLMVALLVLVAQPIQPVQSSLLLAITLTPTDRPIIQTQTAQPPPITPPEDPDLPKTGLIAPGLPLSAWVEPAFDRIAAAPANMQPKRQENGIIYIDASPLVRLEIPALGIRTSIVTLQRVNQTWDISGLDRSVGWLSDTSWPGYGGNTVLAGHLNLDGFRGGPFLFLSSLQAHDRVFLYTQENQLIYEVTRQKLVAANDRTIYSVPGKQKLMLLTCSNWNPNTRTYEKRLLVEANLVGIKGLTFNQRQFKQRIYPFAE